MGVWLVALGYYALQTYREQRHASIRDLEILDFTVAEAAQSAIETHQRRSRDPLPTTSLSALVNQLGNSGLLDRTEVMHLLENELRFRLHVIDKTPKVEPLWLIESRAKKATTLR